MFTTVCHYIPGVSLYTWRIIISKSQKSWVNNGLLVWKVCRVKCSGLIGFLPDDWAQLFKVNVVIIWHERGIFLEDMLDVHNAKNAKHRIAFIQALTWAQTGAV